MLFILKQTVICDNDEKCFLNDPTNATCETPNTGPEEFFALCYGGSKYRLMIDV